MTEVRSKHSPRYSLLLMGLLLLIVELSTMLKVSEVKAKSDDTIVLKIGNWEEYIDQGDWDDDEAIELDSETITSENGLISDFQEWYYDTYGKHVEVEYSTFGTNEDLYSKIILGETYDLVCPSEYMFSKLLKENRLWPLSESFFDTSDEHNYYVNGVSPYIKHIFNSNEIDGKPWSAYAAGYMWGTIGIVYNPEEVSEEDASSWSILADPKYNKRVTIKDSVRESYFPALAILHKDMLLSKEFINSEDYAENLEQLLNDTRPQTIANAEDLLKKIKENVYCFEVDSGKADMVTGKIVANLQWSGDAVYIMEEAEDDGYYLNYAVPRECANLWLDGWVMLKSGINGDFGKQKAAEAFINFISRPDNVIRNMYYIGYTSAISGGDSPLIYEYVNYKFGAQEDEATVEYSLGYFFSGDDEDEEFAIETSEDQAKRLLFTQYPPKDVIDRSAVMGYLPDDVNAQLNQMWINVRCFNFKHVSKAFWLRSLAVICFILILVVIWLNRYRIFRKPIKPGYYRA